MRHVFLSKVDRFHQADGHTVVTFRNRRTCTTRDDGLLDALTLAKAWSLPQFVEVDDSGTLVDVMDATVGRIVRLWPHKAFDHIVVAGSARRISVTDATLRRKVRQLARRRTTCSFAFRADATLAGISPRLGSIPPLSRAKVVDGVPFWPERYRLAEISESAATRALRRLQGRTCKLTRFRSWKKQVCIPFLYASTGCDARAHEMSRELTRRKIPHAKVWCLPLDGDLRFTNNEGQAFQWAFHVAVVVRTKTGDVVLDPSTSETVQPLDHWLHAMHGTAAPVLYSPGRYYSVSADSAEPRRVEIQTDPRGRVCRWYLRSYLFRQTRATRASEPGFRLPR